jgi:hypothetical protein
MKDYSKGKIYKLMNTEDDEVYVGSTTLTLNEIFIIHKWNAKKVKSKLYNHINKIGIDWYAIQLIEHYPCNNKTELQARESELIKKFGTLNKEMTSINKIKCNCGAEICKYYLKRHQTTQKHINRIKAMQLEKN